MGNKSSTKLRNDKINKKIEQDRMRDTKIVKILLLGAGESGKSTIFKQMRIISGVGFSLEARKEFKPKLVLNVVEGTLDILNGMDQLGIKIQSPNGEACANLIEKSSDSRALSQEVVDSILYLWDNDAGFKEAYERRSAFQLQDTWHEFAELLRTYPAWGGKDWVPSVEDVIRARVRTSGIVDELFNINKVPFRMFDVGGQRNERKKWIHSFENVTSIIFVAAIQEYDQVLFEDATQNRLVEAVELFKKTVMNEYFKKTPVILFLNKSDLFREKLCERKVPLNASGLFPQAPNTFDYIEGLEFMKDLFLEGIPSGREMYVYDTCATDTANVDKVFTAASDVILRKNLQNSGLV